MPAHVLCGDSFLVARELRKLESEAGGDALRSGNLHKVSGDGLTLAEIVECCAAAPFLHDVRMVLVEGLLGAAEGRASGRRGRRPAAQRRNSPQSGDRAQPSSRSADPWDGLGQAVSAIPPTTLLVFVDGPVSESNQLLQSLKPVAQVHNLQAPAGEALARWVKTAAEEKGAAIGPAAIAVLTNLIGNDLWALDQELEKLSLYCWGRPIEEADISSMVSQAKEASIFAAVDAMVEGRQGQAHQLLQQLRQDGRDASYIIAMLERQLRLLALARDALDRKIDQRSAGQILGTSSQFVIRKTMAQARKHSWDDIKWRYRRLLEADLSIKQGRVEPDVALEMLVADQSSLARN